MHMLCVVQIRVNIFTSSNSYKVFESKHLGSFLAFLKQNIFIKHAMDAHYIFLFYLPVPTEAPFSVHLNKAPWSLVTNALLFASVRCYIQVLPMSEFILLSSRMEKTYCLLKHVKKKKVVNVKPSHFLFSL